MQAKSTGKLKVCISKFILFYKSWYFCTIYELWMIDDGFMGIYGQLNDGYTYNTQKKEKYYMTRKPSPTGDYYKVLWFSFIGNIENVSTCYWHFLTRSLNLPVCRIDQNLDISRASSHHPGLVLISSLSILDWSRYYVWIIHTHIWRMDSISIVFVLLNH